jgi:hypothetical protein
VVEQLNKPADLCASQSGARGRRRSPAHSRQATNGSNCASGARRPRRDRWRRPLVAKQPRHEELLEPRVVVPPRSTTAARRVERAIRTRRAPASSIPPARGRAMTATNGSNLRPGAGANRASERDGLGEAGEAARAARRGPGPRPSTARGRAERGIGRELRAAPRSRRRARPRRRTAESPRGRAASAGSGANRPRSHPTARKGG